MELAGRTLSVEIGRVAELANGAALVRYGDTVVLATATASEKPRAGIDFFPLSIDYEERLYAVGRIPGSYLKREGRPTEKAILTARVIDRPIRPLFPKDLRNDVSVVITVLSVVSICPVSMLKNAPSGKMHSMFPTLANCFLPGESVTGTSTPPLVSVTRSPSQ